MTKGGDFVWGVTADTLDWDYPGGHTFYDGKVYMLSISYGVGLESPIRKVVIDDATGNTISNTFIANSDEWYANIYPDGSGNFYMIGEVNGGFNSMYNNVTYSNDGYLVIKVDSEFNEIWSRFVPLTSMARDIDLKGVRVVNGNLYFGGKFRGVLDLGDGQTVGESSYDKTFPFITKYLSNGTREYFKVPTVINDAHSVSASMANDNGDVYWFVSTPVETETS